MTTVFCTRALSKSYYRKAAEKGIQIEAGDFIRTEPIHSEELSHSIVDQLSVGSCTLLFTSKNAAKFAFDNYLSSIPKNITHTWKVYCLSGATKNVLLKYFNESQIIGIAPRVKDLGKLMLHDEISQPIHFFCGNRRRNTLPDLLKKHDIPFKEWIIYQTESCPQRVSKQYDGYLFYSPSAVKSFFSVNQIHPEAPCFTIGPTTARILTGIIKNPVYSSPKPTTGNLLQIIEDHFKNKE